MVFSFGPEPGGGDSSSNACAVDVLSSVVRLSQMRFVKSLLEIGPGFSVSRVSLSGGVVGLDLISICLLVSSKGSSVWLSSVLLDGVDGWAVGVCVVTGSFFLCLDNPP